MKPYTLLVLVIIGCNAKPLPVHYASLPDTIAPLLADTNADNKTIVYTTPGKIKTGNLQPAQLLAYAETLIGTPYLYGSTEKSAGFDCSGFITHVFNHFNVAVPRSSIEFTTIETEVPLSAAQAGDLILFTGTDSLNPVVGHMGIIYTVSDTAVRFIHSTSGKANGVTITPLSDYYRGRFVKLIRIFRRES